MSSDPLRRVPVGRFPAVDFRSFDEYEQYCREQKPLIDLRWRYEQSLATAHKQILTFGTCGVCLLPAAFTSSTAGGEIAAGGRVPNWRENLVCDCERRLINRERALLHFLLASGALQSWMRVFACGDLGGLRHLLPELAGGVIETERPPSAEARADGPGPDRSRRQGHLFLWADGLDRRILSPGMLSSIADRLTPGGRFVFTAPFDVAAPDRERPPGATASLDQSEGKQRFIGWDILGLLQDAGFQDAKASMFWSDEYGYLGPLNFIFSATK